MKRTPMVRTAFKRAEPKPPAGPRPRKCSNKDCRKSFTPPKPFIKHCSDECGHAIALQFLVKQKAKKEKLERAEKKRADALHRQQLEETKPLKQQLKLTEKVINEYVRWRDYFDGCISCIKPSHWDGQWHASHFKSVGSNSVLRFNLWNINKACSECNRVLAGNIAEYEKRLVLKIGAEKVEWLKCQGGVKKYNPEYLTRLRQVFAKKTRRLQRRITQL